MPVCDVCHEEQCLCTMGATAVHHGCYGDQSLRRGTTMPVPGSLLFSFLLISLSTKLMM